MRAERDLHAASGVTRGIVSAVRFASGHSEARRTRRSAPASAPDRRFEWFDAASQFLADGHVAGLKLAAEWCGIERQRRDAIENFLVQNSHVASQAADLAARPDPSKTPQHRPRTLAQTGTSVETKLLTRADRSRVKQLADRSLALNRGNPCANRGLRGCARNRRSSFVRLQFLRCTDLKFP